MNLIENSNKLSFSSVRDSISCKCKEVVLQFHYQINHRLILIHERGCSRYLHDNNSAGNMGRRLNLLTTGI